jgi:hypothetical protein
MADLIQVKILMPRALHRKIKRDAERRPGLTINAEICRRLEESFGTSEVDRLQKYVDEAKSTIVDEARSTTKSFEGVKEGLSVTTKLLEDLAKRFLIEEKTKPISSTQSSEDKADD